MFSRSASLSRLVPLVAAAGLTVMLAAGCSGTPKASSGAEVVPSPGQAIELAAAHAALATSVTANLTVQGSGLAGVTMSGSLSEVIKPQLAAELDVPSVSVAGMSLPGGMSEIITTQDAYLKISALSALSGGKPWIKVSLSDLGKALGVNVGQLIQQAESNNPLLQTRLLAGATGVRVVGHGTIGEVPVTEYAGSYELSAALPRLPASLRSQVEQQESKAGITSVTFTAWLDDQQQVRKLILVEHGLVENATVTMLVTSINQPVSIQLPLPADVATTPASALISES